MISCIIVLGSIIIMLSIILIGEYKNRSSKIEKEKRKWDEYYEREVLQKIRSCEKDNR